MKKNLIVFLIGFVISLLAVVFIKWSFDFASYTQDERVVTLFVVMFFPGALTYCYGLIKQI